MIIRAAVRSDLGALLRLLSDPGEAASPRSGTVRMSSAAVRAWTRIEEDPDRCVVVAESRGEVIGTADLLVVANLTHDAQPWGIADNLVVDAAYRRQGVGSALVEDIADRALGAGCYKLELLVREDAPGAHAFYAALGFANSASGFRKYL